MLLPEHERFHQLGPKDVGFDPEKKAVSAVQIMRQTSATGEQINIEVPIYADDSRDQLRDRLGMAYSILQERLEEENKALLNMQEKKKQEVEAEKAAKAKAHEDEMARRREIKDQKKKR